MNNDTGFFMRDTASHEPIKIDTIRIGKNDCYEYYKNFIIGEGSYSKVFLGRCIDEKKINELNIQNGGMIAIKILEIKPETSIETMKNITSEISIMKIIKGNPHDNIIKCYDIIEDFDETYIIMEYCDCGDLASLLIRPIKEDHAKYYFKQILQALKHLDSIKIIHRDIKPKNIMLINKKKTIKICDFGFAKQKTITKTHTMCGSPLYMAPEIFMKIGYNENVDIWALGMILYEMLFSHHPLYKCKDMIELQDTVTNNELIISQNTNINNISNICMDLLSCVLQKNYEKRITLEELLDHAWLKT